MKTHRLVAGIPALTLAGCLVAQLAVADPFTNVPIAGLPGVSEGAVAWADYDRDGRLEFLITGTTNGTGTGGIAQLWRNNRQRIYQRAHPRPAERLLELGGVGRL